VVGADDWDSTMRELAALSRHDLRTPIDVL
jgi:hypothetical protein